MPDGAAAPAGDSHTAPLHPASDAPANVEAQDEWDALAAHDDELSAPDAHDNVMGAHETQDADHAQGTRDKDHARGAQDAFREREPRDGWVVREVEMRRRDAERRLWPAGPPAYPAA